MTDPKAQARTIAERTVEAPVATKQEWAAMNSINLYFTFRERTAFLVGYRLAFAAARREGLEEARALWGKYWDCSRTPGHSGFAEEIAAKIEGMKEGGEKDAKKR